MIHDPEETHYEEGLPLADAIDVSILMHRDAHFGGKFDVMLDYYQKEGKGVNPEFSIERIEILNELEKKSGQNIAPLLLTGPDAERVAHAREAYRKLRKLYESTKTAQHKYPQLIADLILSEEEEPAAEINAIVAEKGAIVPALMDLIRSEDFHDALFPGYGFAPSLAMKCLGLIGDKRSIITLFESIGESDFFEESLAIDALHLIGNPAKEFLLRVLHARPLTYDNERAAMALLQFKDDPEVSKTCLKMLKEIDLRRDNLLATHLILVCEGLSGDTQRQEFLALANTPNIPSSLRKDMLTIAETWNLPKKINE